MGLNCSTCHSAVSAVSSNISNCVMSSLVKVIVEQPRGGVAGCTSGTVCGEGAVRDVGSEGVGTAVGRL